jgi:hypothetical protein
MLSAGKLSLEIIILKLKFFYAISFLEVRDGIYPENVHLGYKNSCSLVIR